MSAPDPVRKKIFRAKQNFDELTTEVLRYFKGNPGEMVVEPESTSDQIVATFQPKHLLPARLPLIAGDCLQNLRSSLDYLVWELVLAEGKDPGKHTCFPVCPGPDSDSFDKAIEWRGKRPGVLEGIDADAVTEIRNLQPFRLGQNWEMDPLWILNELTNLNKHRRILLAKLEASDAPSDFRIIDVDGQIWGKGSFSSTGTDAKIAPFPTNDPNMHRQIVVFIKFDETVAKGKEVCSVLEGLFAYLYDMVLPKFDRFFA